MPANLLDYFDRVVVINLARRPERLAQFRARFADWPFHTPERLEAIDGSTAVVPQNWTHGPGAWGCRLSHRVAVATALEQGVSSLFVLEDDAMPAADFAAGAEAFLASVPADWEVLMFGAQHLSPPTPVSPGVDRCAFVNRCHGYALRGRAMAGYIAMLDRFDTDHCDVVLGSLMPHLNAYAPRPLLIGQSAGVSDITGREEEARFLTL